MRRRSALGLLAGAAWAGEMDSLRSWVKAFLRDWLDRGDVERAMGYFDESCWADALMASNRCLFGTSAWPRTPEMVRRDVRRTLAKLTGARARDRKVLDGLAADAKEQGLTPYPGCLREGFLCLEGDRAFVKLLLAKEDLDAHGKRCLALIQAGGRLAGMAVPLRDTAAAMIWQRFGRL